MQRDMELVRKILFEIENKHIDVAIYDLEIPEYDFKSVANHCKILYEAKLINDYGDIYADNELLSFGVGGLTWEGHEFIDKIRSEKVWRKTKNAIISKGLPMTIDVLRQVATNIIMSMIKVET